MRFIVFLLVSIALLSCGSQNTGEQEMVMLDGDYRITGLYGSPVQEEGVFLRFDPETYSVSGFSGCDSFSAGYKLDGVRFDFNRAVSTQKYCEEKMDTEDQIYRAIKETAEIQQEEEVIRLYSESREAIMTLKKQQNRE